MLRAETRVLAAIGLLFSVQSSVDNEREKDYNLSVTKARQHRFCDGC